MLHLFLMTPPQNAGGGAGDQLMSFLIMFGPLIAIMYFMIIRPQQKRAKQQQALISSVKKGDAVTMSGGMHGTVNDIDDSTVTVTIAPNCHVKFEKSSIANVSSK
jgi:preprotein translocase subunit YajC